MYPYGVTDTLSEEKTLKAWQAVVWLENDYIEIMILPELGGRVHRAWDKVRQRDFVYHEMDVIKPALVGLLGLWISGGIEFNWPQHHRPTTICRLILRLAKMTMAQNRLGWRDGADAWAAGDDRVYSASAARGIRDW